MSADLLNKLLDIQDAQNSSRYAEARDLMYRLICETRRDMVSQQEKSPARTGL